MRAFGAALLLLFSTVDTSIVAVPASAQTNACVAGKGTGTIAGRLAVAASAKSARIKFFVSSETSSAYLDTVKQTLKPENRLINVLQINTPVSSPSDLARLLRSATAPEAGADYVRRFQAIRAFLRTQASAPSATLNEEGRFVCVGFAPGSYDLLAAVQNEVAAPEYLKKYAAVVPETAYYAAAHVLVPKPKGHASSIVQATRFVLLGRQ